MIKVGFTGTRHGMNEVQQEEFLKLINSKEFSEFHHGMCIGSDKQAHDMVTKLKMERTKNGKGDIKRAGHPPKYKGSMADCECDILMKADEYLVRNHNIVDHTDVLVATPDTKEKIRSGTWSTVRYARKLGKKIYIIHKNGRVTIE